MTLNCNGKLIDLSQPKIMGIVNLTPDSFYDGGKLNTDSQLLNLVETMLNNGADMIDVGGQSTRPNADFLTAEQETQRTIPCIDLIAKNFPDLVISVDTFWAKVAKQATEFGASIVNDISAGSIDKNMHNTIAQLQVPYVLMHMQGNPTNMQNAPFYEDVVLEVNQFFSEHLKSLQHLKVNDVILDPGFGFGKTLQHNYTLLNNLNLIGYNNYPIMVGLSRKSMIYKLLETTPTNALHGTIALNTIALLKGASILRVHDVQPAKELTKLLPYLNS